MSKKSNNIENREKLNLSDNYDFELIYSDDIKKIKELESCKASENSTYISEIQKEIEHPQSPINTIKNEKSIKSYISIDSKNYFGKSDLKKSEEMNKRFKNKYQINDLSNNLKELSNSIKDKIYKVLFPGIKQDFFSISLNIMKILDKEDLLSKSKIEKNMNYFFLREKIYSKTKILIDFNFINNCGPIIGYVYKRLKKYKIKDNIYFINVVNKIIYDNINVKNDFDLRFSENKSKDENYEKMKYFKKIRNNYIILPEIIYLINLFSSVRKIIIDINILEKDYKSYMFYYFVLCMYNIPYIMKYIDCIKFTIMNESLFKYRKEINEKKLIKENCITYKKNKNGKIFAKKETLNEINNDYFLNQYKLIDTKKNFLKAKLNKGRKTLGTFSFTDLEMIMENSPNSNLDFVIINNSENNDSLKKEQNIEKHFFRNWFKSNSEDMDLSTKVMKLYKILEMIVITLFSFENFEYLDNLELILIDTCYSELINYFKIKFQFLIDNFHILYLIYNQIIELKSLNLEINSFDLITFNEILSIIYNSKASNFKLSLFTQEFIYSSPFLYKVYRQGLKKKIIKEDKHSNDKNLKFNDRFFKNIFHYFEKNLNSLFEILKNKRYKSFGISFNIPAPILNNDKYILVIIKFIMNILILFLDNENSTTEELSILSPPLVFNGIKHFFFEEFLENINIKNKKLSILDLHFKFYNIRNLHKFIPQNLVILNIGDFDIISLKFFVNYITQYKFIKNSSLQQLSIKINNTIIKLNEDIKFIFAKLFNINITNLLIFLYTNIQLNSQEFQDIINLLQDNLIHTYNLSFNSKSEQIIKDNYKLTKKLICIEPKEPGYSKMGSVFDFLDGKKEKQMAHFSEVYLCLIHQINKMAHKNKTQIDFFTQKKLTTNIYKYLYVTNNPIVKFYEKEN